LRVVDGPFSLVGIPFVPVPLLHGEMDVLGFRFGRAAYMTDFSRLPESSVPLLEDLDDLILDALRDVPHPMHQTVEQALALIDQLKPKRAWFTHIAHDLAHEATNARLRKAGYAHVQLAYDGLTFEVQPVAVAPGRATLPVHLHRGNRGIAVFCSANDWSSRFATTGRGSVVAIGTFDGIHLGHQEVLRFAIARAKDCEAVATALTFEPPPVKVLRPELAPPRISTNRQRLDWFEIVGMEAAVVLPFTKDLAALTAEEFVEQILVKQLLVRSVVVGENFKFGRGQSGNVGLLRELGMRLGFEVVVHTPVMLGGEVVSSTLVRKAVAAGDVRRAAKLLGRPFALTGEVVSGTGTGKKFLFPTLNLKPEQELLPARGVYITRTVLEGETSSHRSVTNVGVRPTFNGAGLSIETHLLDYSGNFTPKKIEVRFWKRLREEKKFAGVDELKAQIQTDILMANRFFGKLRGTRTRMRSE
jgi:riboflavin kinase / FMN adenylyltransferase